MPNNPLQALPPPVLPSQIGADSKAVIDREVRLQRVEDRLKLAGWIAGFFGLSGIFSVVFLIDSSQKLAAARLAIEQLTSNLTQISSRYKAEIETAARTAIETDSKAMVKQLASEEEALKSLAVLVNGRHADQIVTIQRLQKQVAAIYQALSFGYGTRKAGVSYNGSDDGGPASPKCPSGSVMTGVRHSGYNYENGEIDCISLKPADIP